MSELVYLNNFTDSISADLTYIAITSNYDTPQPGTQINDLDQNEIHRFVPDIEVISSEIKVSVLLNNIEVPESFITSIINQRQFVVNNSSGFTEGSSIILNYDKFNPEKIKIIDVTGNQITLDKESNFGLSLNMKVIIGLEYIHFITGGSTVANTGFTMFTKALNLVKFPNTEQSFDLIFEGKIMQ